MNYHMHSRIARKPLLTRVSEDFVSTCEHVRLHQNRCNLLLWISISGFESLGGSQISSSYFFLPLRILRLQVPLKGRFMGRYAANGTASGRTVDSRSGSYS